MKTYVHMLKLFVKCCSLSSDTGAKIYTEKNHGPVCRCSQAGVFQYVITISHPGGLSLAALMGCSH